MVDSCRRVTEGQQIRMNQKKTAKHEEWSRRNIVFLMMRSVDCMWKPFFCRYFAGIEFWSLGCHDYGKHKSTRDHQNPHHDLHQKHVLNMPIPLLVSLCPAILRCLRKVPVLLKTFRFPLEMIDFRRIFPCCISAPTQANGQLALELRSKLAVLWGTLRGQLRG